ncbi:glycosyltransferase family 2 protein [Patescibacteria group bacterium]
MKTLKLSVVLLAINEEKNVDRNLSAIKDIADEIIFFIDKRTTDRTEELARKYTDKIYFIEHEDNFHINKQKAIEKAKGKWILQLDVDEAATPELAKEIKEVVNLPNEDLLKRVLTRKYATHYTQTTKHKLSLFARHQKLIEEREGKLGKSTGEVVAFFIPRVNLFLGKPLIHAGVYPDGVIRLFKRGYARLPAKSVHELMEVDGEVGWLFNNLEHNDTPTLSWYIARMNRYTDLNVDEMKDKKVPKNLFYLFLYITYHPLITFCKLYFRHKGFLDGIRGFLWSVLSSLHFPIAYFKYWQCGEK